ncbi:hypothetical protein A3759_03095 [Thalassolituus sp. HI0120]|nr:hypothetical protein A3759_03095 [Thalassolituus sp. HI0120]
MLSVFRISLIMLSVFATIAFFIIIVFGEHSSKECLLLEENLLKKSERSNIHSWVEGILQDEKYTQYLLGSKKFDSYTKPYLYEDLKFPVHIIGLNNRYWSVRIETFVNDDGVKVLDYVKFMHGRKGFYIFPQESRFNKLNLSLKIIDDGIYSYCDF